MTTETQDELEAVLALLKSCRMMLGWSGYKPSYIAELEQRREVCKCKNPAQWCVANKGPEHD